ncbi:MAG: FHA domain-containing protein [Bdellovibrionales bacterium]
MSEAATRDVGALPIKITFCMPTSDEERLVVGSTIVVGRGSSADAIFSHSELSRKHFRIDLFDGALYITDLNSSNGTHINGQQLVPGEPTPVSPDDRIGFGGPQLYYFKVTFGESLSERQGSNSANKALGPQLKIVNKEDKSKHFLPEVTSADDSGLSLDVTPIDEYEVDSSAQAQAAPGFENVATAEQKEAFHDIRRAEAVIKGLDIKKKNIQAQVNNLNSSKVQMEKKLNEYNGKLEQLDAAIRAYQDKAKEIENSLQHLQRDQENEKEKLQVLYEEKKKAIAEKKVLAEEIKKLADEKEFAAAEKAKYTSQLEKHKKETEEAIKKLDQARAAHFEDEQKALEKASKARSILTELNSNIDLQNITINDFKKSISQLDIELASKKGELNQSIERFQYYVGANKKIMDQHKDIKDDFEKIKIQYDDFVRQLNIKKRDLNIQDEKERESRNQAVHRMHMLTERMSELEEEIEIKKNTIAEYDGEVINLQKKIEIKKNEINEIGQLLNNKANELSINKEKEEEIDARILEKDKKADEIDKEIRDRTSELRNKESELALKQQIIEQHDEKVSKISSEMDELQASLSELREAEKSLNEQIQDLEHQKKIKSRELEEHVNLLNEKRDVLVKEFDNFKFKLESDKEDLSKNHANFKESIEFERLKREEELKNVNDQIDLKVKSESALVQSEVAKYRQRLEDELDDLKQEKLQLEKEINQMERLQESKEDMLEREFQAKHAHLDREFKDARERYTSLEEKLHSYRKEKGQLEINIDEGLKKLEKITKTQTLTEETISELQLEIKKLNQQLQVTENEKDKAALSLENYKQEVLDKMKAIDADHSVKVSMLTAERKKIEIEKLDLEKEVKATDEVLDQHKIVLEETINEEKQLRVDIEQHHMELKSLQSKIGDTTAQLNQLISDHSDMTLPIKI